MKFTLIEDYKNNNEINKKKYKKHSQSPFTKLDAGNVEYNNSVFNSGFGNGSTTAMAEAYDEMGDVDYNLEEDIGFVCDILDMDKEELSQEVNLEDKEEFYNYVYNKGIRLTNLRWQIAKEENPKKFILCHGSRTGIKGEIRVNVNGDSNDFANGFYCGQTPMQAGMFVATEPESSLYIVEFDRAKLTPAKFKVSVDWMLAVAYYRGTIDKYKNHKKIRDIVNKVESSDYVIAPIADNRMFQLIDSFTRNEITDLQCMHALAATHLGYQFVFKSEACISHLTLTDRMYLCASEKADYNRESEIESNTSLSKAIIARKRYKEKGNYLRDILI